MGNCCSDVAGGRAAVGGGASSQSNPPGSLNDAVDCFLTSRGYRGLFSQIEVLLSLYFIVLHIDSHKSVCVCVCVVSVLVAGSSSRRLVSIQANT